MDPWRNRLIGFQLAHEQLTVPELVELGIAAEQAGFDLLASSDHFQPWQANEAHSGQAWVTLSAIGQRTSRLSGAHLSRCRFGRGAQRRSRCGLVAEMAGTFRAAG